MISGMIDYSKNHESYLSVDSVFVNRSVIFCSDSYKNLAVVGKYVILSDETDSSAVYCEKESSTTLTCGTSENSILYYTFIGTTLVFSSDIKDIIQKCRVILSNDRINNIIGITPEKLAEILKNITAVPKGGRLTYTESGVTY